MDNAGHAMDVASRLDGPSRGRSVRVRLCNVLKGGFRGDPDGKARQDKERRNSLRWVLLAKMTRTQP